MNLCVYEEVVKIVRKWITTVRNHMSFQISQLKKKHIFFAEKLGFIDFCVSSRWLDKF